MVIEAIDCTDEVLLRSPRTQLLTSLSCLPSFLERVVDENVLLIDKVGCALVHLLDRHALNNYFVSVTDAEVTSVLGQHTMCALLLVSCISL